MSVSEPVVAPASPGESQAESVILILSGQSNTADLDVKGQGLKCIADAESHCSVHYWKALECCSRAKCIPKLRAKLAFREVK